MDGAAAKQVRADLILIVDDDFQIQKMLARDLTRLGYSVVQALTGQEGLILAENSHPALILLDLRMPGMDGHTFLRRLRKNSMDVSVIVMSGAGDMEDVVEVLRLGALDYLKKPWTMGEITAAISRAMTIGQLRRGATAAQVSDQLDAPGEEAPQPIAAPAGSAPPAASDLGQLDAILQRIRDGKVPLHSVPAVVSELRTLLSQPDTHLEAVVALIGRDQRLAIDVLRLSNTPEFARRHGRNHDLKIAVQRIGFRRIGGIVETIFLSGLMRVADAKFRELLLTLWRHSLARAIAMRALAELTAGDHRPDPDAAYIAGLLADVGAAFLISVMGDRGGSASFAVDDRLFAFLYQYHEEIGSMVLTSWNLGQEAIRVARYHHESASSIRADPYWMLSVLSAEIAESLAPGTDITAAGHHSAGTIEECLAGLGLGESILEGLPERLRGEYAAILATLA